VFLGIFQQIASALNRCIYCLLERRIQKEKHGPQLKEPDLLHESESFLISGPVFAASQEIPRIFMEPESSLPYLQVPATRPYPEPTPSRPHYPLQLN
jgi:hypothetical protein